MLKWIRWKLRSRRKSVKRFYKDNEKAIAMVAKNLLYTTAFFGFTFAAYYTGEWVGGRIVLGATWAGMMLLSFHCIEDAEKRRRSSIEYLKKMGSIALTNVRLQASLDKETIRRKKAERSLIGTEILSFWRRECIIHYKRLAHLEKWKKNEYKDTLDEIEALSQSDKVDELDYLFGTKRGCNEHTNQG